MSTDRYYVGNIVPADAPADAPTVRIVHVSDTHNEHRRHRIPNGDILVHSGDFLFKRNSEETDAQLLEDFNEWLGELPHAHKIVIAGNHEKIFNDMSEAEIEQALSNATYLCDSGVTCMGLRFWGTPWNGARGSCFSFGTSRAERRSAWEKIPTGEVDVLITHMPPFNILDLAGSHRNTSTDECAHCGEAHPGFSHWGDASLVKHVTERVLPRIHLFGHVHECCRAVTDHPSGVIFVNSAVDFRGAPHTFDMSPLAVSNHGKAAKAKGKGKVKKEKLKKEKAKKKAKKARKTKGPSQTQLWTVLDSGAIQHATSQLCLDVDYSGKEERTAVIAWRPRYRRSRPGHARKNQAWTLEPVEGAPSDVVRIRSRLTADRFALSVRSNGTLNVRRVGDYDVQRWKTVSDGEHHIGLWNLERHAWLTVVGGQLVLERTAA